MKAPRQRLGASGERLAQQRLRALGYHILATNYRTSSGELDVVAQQGETLVFVEVRTRRGGSFGLPEDSITSKKQSKLVELAQAYLQERGLTSAPWRIDVVAVELTPSGRLRRIEVIQNAVSG